MNMASGRTQTRTQKLGWGILILISVLMALNGVAWFFVGPARTPAYMANVAGMPEAEFRETFPALVDGLARNRRQVGVWYTAFGSMATLVAFRGFRHGPRWAWTTSWLVPAAPAAIGIVYMPGGRLDIESAVLLAFGGLALLGQVLARPAGAVE